MPNLEEIQIEIDCLIERAAIMEFDGGMTRVDAQNAAARLRGMKDWDAAREFVKGSKKESGGRKCLDHTSRPP